MVAMTRDEWNQIQIDVVNFVRNKVNSRGNCMCDTCKGRSFEEIVKSCEM